MESRMRGLRGGALALTLFPLLFVVIGTREALGQG